MNLNLKRTSSTALSTIGQLDIDDVFYCYTLERPEVQIPLGNYQIEITFSPRFNRPLPLLDRVQGRTDIRIHAGNFPKDTEGCILVGLTKDVDCIWKSRLALDPLVDKILAAVDRDEKITITIT